jgi:hypothetical protein
MRNVTIKLEETNTFLVECRSEKGFENSLVDVHELAEEIPALFEMDLVHIRRKGKQFIHEADDEPVQSPKEKFRVNFYFVVLDRAIQLVEEIFTQIHQISFVFGFLFNIHSLHNRIFEQTMEE